MQRSQFIAGSPAELGVQGQYLDSELHLVGDALAGWLLLRPQFEIGRRVVNSVSILVMNIFVFVQRAAKYFSHYKAMFESLCAATQVDTNVSGRMNVALRVNGPPVPSVVPAFGRTKYLTFLPAFECPIFAYGWAVLRSFAAALALECRRCFGVHVHCSSGSGRLVKEFN